MKYIVVASLAAVGFAAIYANGCSRSDQEAVVERVREAGDALLGNPEGEGREPKIVREQMRKERIRQETKWTPENQARHPIEYCQAQLEETANLAKTHEANMFTYRRTKAELQRRQADETMILEKLTNGLASCKAAYRQATATSQWPMTFNGYALEKDKAEENIVEMARRIKCQREKLAALPIQIARVDKKLDALAKEQRKIAEIRERLQDAIVNLKTKQVIDGVEGVSSALSAINASLDALDEGADPGTPTIEEMITPSRKDAVNEEFRAIMAE